MDYKIASCIQSPAAWPQLPKSHLMKLIILVRGRSKTALTRRGKYIAGSGNVIDMQNFPYDSIVIPSPMSIGD